MAMTSNMYANYIFKQEKECNFNLILRRFRTTIVVVEKQRILHNSVAFVALGGQHAMFICSINIFHTQMSLLLCTVTDLSQI
jgi:hypothetical protein